jgi:quinol-cytochrome oxidoreductase complex cytochrome b subunit
MLKTPSSDQVLLQTSSTEADQSHEDRINIRAVFNNLVLHLHPATVPAPALKFTYTWGLGGISTVLVFLLVFTGILLMFRYDPDAERAYMSILALETEVAFGSLIRGIHHWSANLLVVTIFLHLLRVFLIAGFKQTRAMNWVAGIFLLMTVLAANFSGYLLPWDQLAYWAITVSTSLFSYIPIIGHEISDFVLAGPEVGHAALRNFYAFHIAVVPLFTGALLAYHFWKIRKSGGLSQPEEDGFTRKERLTTIPHLLSRELAAAAAVIAVILIWSMLKPAPLQDMANPSISPNPAKAAWYFAGLQELLLHMDALSAMGLVLIILMGLALLPWIDRRGGDIGIYFRSQAGKEAALVGSLLSLALVPVLVLVDEYWLDLPALLPDWPVFITTGLVPLILTLAGLVVVYFLGRLVTKSNHSEGLVGLFMFLVVSLIILTVVGVFFRGPNMALMI